MIRRAWINGGDAVTVVRQCALAGVSRATVYARRHPKPMDEMDLLHSGLIDAEYTRHPFYGSRKMVVFLGKAGHCVNRKRVQRLMRLMGLAGMAPGPNTSRAHPMHKIHPYETVIGAGGATLSGGMRQRIGLARALFGKPRLVVLDEPSANLESDGEQALLRALHELRARRATVILVTHQMGLLKDVDFIGVVVDGQLKSYSPRAEIMRQNANPAVQPLRSV